jgi:uncharacterized protein (TIGR03435 family)
MLLLVRAMNPQPPPASAAPHFDVASVKPCDPNAAVVRTSRGGGGSPGLLRMNCQTVRDLVLTAYAAYANGRRNLPPLPPVEGGPKWIDSERYTIDAKAEGSPDGNMMHGLMLQALLEDRFQLKIRRDFRDGPAYALTLANGGPRLQPHQEGSCIDVGAVQPANGPPPPHAPGERPALCGYNRPGPRNGTNVILDVPGVTLDYFARTFLSIAFPDRPVVDKTGLAGLFDIHLEFTPDPGMPGPATAPGDSNGNTNAGPAVPADTLAAGPSIFAALQEQLGLKLVPARGPREFIVIVQVEHPPGN